MDEKAQSNVLFSNPFSVIPKRSEPDNSGSQLTLFGYA